MQMNRARVIDIKRFAVHDGDGIRTTVFLKGCPLQCVWCHNPEGISFEPQLAYYSNKCIGCGECVSICKSNAHTITNLGHALDRSRCMLCGECESVCLGNAIKFYGREMAVDDLVPLLIEDKIFYDHSGGGITISGGEPLIHPDFCAELLRKMKERKINTAVDTCGFVPRACFDQVIPYTDTFLFDVKAFDTDVHKICTGCDNDRILSNLEYLEAKSCRIEIRIPYVPNYNCNQIEKIANYLNGFRNIVRVRVLPYHNYAGSKYSSLDMISKLPEHLPTNEEVLAAEKMFRANARN